MNLGSTITSSVQKVLEAALISQLTMLTGRVGVRQTEEKGGVNLTAKILAIDGLTPN